MKALEIALVATFSLTLIPGCTTIPDVSPFADTTSSLAASAGLHYGDLVSDLDELTLRPRSGESDAQFEARQKAFEASKSQFKDTQRHLDALFMAMTEFSERIVSLAASGEKGPEAAESILESAGGLMTLAGGAGQAVSPEIVSVFKAIADEFTKRQARKSLGDAMAAIEPGVDRVAEVVETIYGQALIQAAQSVRDQKQLQASIAAGPAVVGFHANVVESYNAYYRHLNGLIHSDTGNVADWRGFCQAATGPCRAKEELEAVGLVEARMSAISPLVTAYRMEVDTIEANYKNQVRQANAIVKAVKAWTLEYRKVRKSLNEGSPMSATTLRAVLLELQQIQESR